jgi:sporulation protein YlmC with PRC-barrel domain
MKRTLLAGAVALMAATTAMAEPMKLGTTGAVTTQSATDYRSTKLVGTNVYNSAGESIGEINDIVMDEAGNTKAVIVSVGGFLGMGTRYVAVPFSSMKVARESNGTIKLTMESTKETLKAMPEFTFYKS